MLLTMSSLPSCPFNAGGTVWTHAYLATCRLLSLEYPDIQVRRLNEQCSKPRGHYYAAAFFRNDPFLTRAGAIGEVNSAMCTGQQIQEMCTERVLQYLIAMVKEDTLLEQAEAKARFNREKQWARRVIS